jgi:hypothetical protein
VGVGALGCKELGGRTESPIDGAGVLGTLKLGSGMEIESPTEALRLAETAIPLSALDGRGTPDSRT